MVSSALETVMVKSCGVKRAVKSVSLRTVTVRGLAVTPSDQPLKS